MRVIVVSLLRVCHGMLRDAQLTLYRHIKTAHCSI